MNQEAELRLNICKIFVLWKMINIFNRFKFGFAYLWIFLVIKN